MFDNLRGFMGLPEPKVTRRVPMRPEWKEILDRMKELMEDRQLVNKKIDHMYAELLVKVRNDMETYDNFRVSDDLTHIEFLEL